MFCLMKVKKYRIESAYHVNGALPVVKKVA